MPILEVNIRDLVSDKSPGPHAVVPHRLIIQVEKLKMAIPASEVSVSLL